MFKNLELFNGTAEDLNLTLNLINVSLACHGKGKLDVCFAKEWLNEENIEDSGYGDCLNITHDGANIATWLTPDEALCWLEGFSTTLSIFKLY